MLSVRPKITDLNFHLYARNIHPELFEVCASRTWERDNYRLELNITTDGHLLSFHHDDLILTEVSASAHHPLPSQRILLSHPIEGVCHDETKLEEVISYQAKVELEAVDPKIFVAIQQQLDGKAECEGLVHRFHSNGRLAFGALSYINVQSFLNHVLVRCLHTFPDTSAVIKSESRFSLDFD
ncbi:MAG: DUF2617 family protein [Mariniblastus sp.]